MAKPDVTTWDTTASGNEDLGGTSILGTAPVSNFSDALQELMAQVRSGMDTGNIMGSAYLTKSGSYTLLTTDRGKTVNCTASLTLAAQAAATLGAGWMCIIKANGGDVTIDPNGAETINGAATYVVYDGNSAEVICDGTNFQVVHSGPIVTKWVEYTPTLTGFGTPTDVNIFSRRVGDTLQIRGKFTAGTTTADPAEFTIGFNGTNGGLTTDVNKILDGRNLCGHWASSLALARAQYMIVNGSASTIAFSEQTGSRASLTQLAGNNVASAGDDISVQAEVCITGW